MVEALNGVMPDYEIPADDLVGEVLIPAISGSDEVRIGAGFFSSHCLAKIAQGLAEYLARDGVLRLLASTELSAEDRKAVETGVATPQRAIEAFSLDLLSDARSTLARHAADCLAYLVARDRLQIRFVLMPSGMYHKKKWLLREGTNWAAIHGSGNATARGLLVNGEQMTIDRPWMDGESSRTRVGRLVRQFDRQWENRHEESLTIEPKQMLRLLLERTEKLPPPTTKDFGQRGIEIIKKVWSLPCLLELLARRPSDGWRSPGGSTGTRHRTATRRLRLIVLENAAGSGILAIATGGGKTRTALIAATRHQNLGDEPVLVVVLVPSRTARTAVG